MNITSATRPGGNPSRPGGRSYGVGAAPPAATHITLEAAGVMTKVGAGITI